MFLKEWDSSIGPSGSFVEREYPDAVLKPFIEAVLGSPLRMELDTLGGNPQNGIALAYRKMQTGLRDHRNNEAMSAANAAKMAAAKPGQTVTLEAVGTSGSPKLICACGYAAKNRNALRAHMRGHPSAQATA